MTSPPTNPDSPRYRVMRTPGHYAVLLNARAKGWTGEVHHAVQRYVSPKDLFLTDDFHQARRTVDKLLNSGYDALFAGGGDGTIMYLINELEQRIQQGQITREEAPPIGVLRLGTGNAIANYLGSHDIIHDLRTIKSGAPLTVHAVNMIRNASEALFPFAGIGWDADILNDYEVVKQVVRDTSMEQYATGLGGYAAAIASRTIPRVVRQPPVMLRIYNLGPVAKQIDFEGRVLREFDRGALLYEGPARICGASSIPYWGFRVRMFPHADAHPELFQLRCFFGSAWEVLGGLRNFWRGKVREESIFDALVSHARVEIEGAPLPYQVSGDAMGLEREIEWQISDAPVQLAVPLR